MFSTIQLQRWIRKLIGINGNRLLLTGARSFVPRKTKQTVLIQKFLLSFVVWIFWVPGTWHRYIKNKLPYPAYQVFRRIQKFWFLQAPMCRYYPDPYKNVPDPEHCCDGVLKILALHEIRYQIAHDSISTILCFWTGWVHDQKYEGRIHSKMPDSFHSGPVANLWS